MLALDCSGLRPTTQWQPPGPASCSRPTQAPIRRCSSCARSANQDLDWEPDLRKSTPSAGPSRGGGGGGGPQPPLRPLRPPPVPWYEVPFASRRNIAITLLAGSTALWLKNNKFGPVQFADKPTVPFKMLGFTDLDENDFVYFKTQGGNWVAAAEDELGRLFMVDQAGDLYYDSGDQDIGMYIMDTQGNLFNYYNDIGGKRKITPVGNVSDLKSFKINELAGVKLDRDVNVVAFQDGSEIPLPPGTGYVDESGRFVPPGELVEGFSRTPDEPGNPFTDLFRLRPDRSSRPPDRVELDLEDPTPFERQVFDQVLLTDDAGLPYLPEDFDIDEFEEEVKREMQEKAADKSDKAGSKPEGRRPAVRRQ